MAKAANVSKYAAEICQAIDNETVSLRELSLKIHSNPELGYKEVLAHKALTDYVEAKGFKVTRHAYQLDTAFIAEYESPATAAAVAAGETVRAVGFCSEYDALPGIGHACGHNLIAIAGVASALAIKLVLERHNLVGRVRLIGTPAEETTGGKIPLIERGAFDGLDCCMMTHPSPGDLVYPTILSVGGFLVEYFGKASHASASPWEGVNALDALVQAYNGLGLLRQQTPTTCRIHCIITSGGQAANIIPEYAAGKIMYRSTVAEDHVKLREKVIRVAKAAAEGTGCTVKITEEMEYQPLPHSEPLAARYSDHSTDLGVKFMPRADQERQPSGSTDMGNVAHYLPSIHPVYNVSSLEGIPNPEVTNHSIRFTELAGSQVGHDATLRSAKGLALTAIDVYVEDGFAESIKADFETRILKGKSRSKVEGVAEVKARAEAISGFSAGGCGCH